MRLPLLALLLLAACARPLSAPETAFLSTVQGPQLNTAPVRIHKGALIGNITQVRPPRPAVACRERIRPAETGPVRTGTAGVVLGSRLFAARRWYDDDYLGPYPQALPLDEAMFLAHEMTHVWQWQARATTGYHPLKAAAEQQAGDPYLFDLEAKTDLLDYGYEQQASLVEEFVCCRALDPEGARTARLHALLTPHFPTLSRREAAEAIVLPWPQAPVKNICA